MITGALFFASASQAQTVGSNTQPNSSAPSAAQDAGGIQDIVVTAQRKSENLQRAPIAISAIGGDQLRNAGVVAAQDLTALVPALQVVSAGAYPLYYIRGVGTINANPLSDSAIAVSFNDVYIGRPTSTNGLYYDLDRIEVLKGPQGTLYGRNATGGSINIIPRRPVLGQYGGEASLEYGNYNAVRFDGAVNIPVNDIAALRVAGIAVRHDGYMNNGNSNQDDAGGRASLLVKPTPDLTINLEGDYYSQGGNGAGSVVVPNGVKGRIDVTSPEAAAFYTSQPVSIAGRNFPALQNTSRQNNQYWGASATVNWTPEWGSVTFIPAYRGAKVDFVTNTPGFELTQRENDRQFSGELRIASNDDHPLRWMLGGFYFKENISVPDFVPNSQYNLTIYRYHTGTESSAAFGRLTYAITPKLKINAGGRFTHERKFLDGINLSQNRLCIDLPAFVTQQQVVLAGSCPGAAPFPQGTLQQVNALVPFNPASPFAGLNEIYGNTAILQTASAINTSEKNSVNRFTWRAGADWQITSRNLLYANYETGFKAGGFFFTSDPNGTYRPEKIKAFTIGSKNRFLDNKLQLNVEGFYWKYTDQQISVLGYDSQRNFILPTRNVGNADYKGFEVETQFAVTRNTVLNADVQYLDANYKKFIYEVPNQGPPVTGCSTSGLGAPTVTINCSGLRPPNAPEWTINLGAQQTINLASGANVVVNGRGHYQTRTLEGLDFVPQQYQAAYWLMDGTITFNTADRHMFVSAFVNNAFNKTTFNSSIVVAFSRFIQAQLNNPRTYGIRAGFRF
jgi:iron complex outermembrane receptor protein